MITLDDVVTDGVQFLKSLTEYYGTDAGMAAWEAMNASLGNEVKGLVFFAMITGGFSPQLTINTANCMKIVDAIKAIRSATGCGLKEAKDKYDAAKVSPVTLTVKDSRTKTTLALQLAALGVLTT